MVFGQPVHVLSHDRAISKFSSRTIEAFAIGYGSRVNTYRCFMLNSSNILVTSDVKPGNHWIPTSGTGQQATFIIAGMPVVPMEASGGETTCSERENGEQPAGTAAAESLSPERGNGNCEERAAAPDAVELNNISQALDATIIADHDETAPDPEHMRHLLEEPEQDNHGDDIMVIERLSVDELMRAAQSSVDRPANYRVNWKAPNFSRRASSAARAPQTHQKGAKNADGPGDSCDQVVQPPHARQAGPVQLTAPTGIRCTTATVDQPPSIETGAPSRIPVSRMRTRSNKQNYCAIASGCEPPT